MVPICDKVLIATKFGLDSELATGARCGGTKSRPDHIRAVADAPPKRLGTDHIDLFKQHRVDPNAPIEEAAGPAGKLITEGKVTHWG